jgi:hypothetical protein
MQEEDTVETMGATEAPSEPTKEEIEEVKPLLELYQWLHAECYKPVWTVADPLGWNMDTLAVKHENGFIFARHDRPGWGLLMMLYSPNPDHNMQPFRLTDQNIVYAFWQALKLAQIKASQHVLKVMQGHPKKGERLTKTGNVIYLKKEDAGEKEDV